MSHGGPPPNGANDIPPVDIAAGKKRISPTERRTVERVRQQRPGDAVVRVRRARFQGFSRTAEAHLEARAELEKPRDLAGVLKRWLVGEPIHAALESHERLTKKKALAVFSSDALSSVAYTPQETLVILLVAGTAAGDRGDQLSANHLHLSLRRRQLHRRPCEPWRNPWSRRCRRAHRWLCPHCLGVR